MSKSKILYPFLIMGLLMFLFSGCGSSTDKDETKTEQEQVQEEPEPEQEEPEPEPEEPEPEPEEPEPEPEEQEIPGIPHVLDGRDACLGCHNTETTLPVPADHQGRTDAVCTGCHEVVSNPSGAMAGAIPHTLDGREDCLMCHAEGTSMGVPASHAGRTVEVCTACHQPG